MDGILKQLNPTRTWGIIYVPGDQRFFFHIKRVISGKPELFRRVTFDIGPSRNPAELPLAINVVISDAVTQSSHSALGSSEVSR
jgi:hypothetical protein